MDFVCAGCKQNFTSEHDVAESIDMDTNREYFVCHDCLIIQSRPRQWMMKANMKAKTQAMELKWRVGKGNE